MLYAMLTIILATSITIPTTAYPYIPALTTQPDPSFQFGIAPNEGVTSSPEVNNISAADAHAKEILAAHDELIERAMDEMASSSDGEALDEQLRTSRTGHPRRTPAQFFLQGFFNFVIPVSIVFLIVILFHYYVCKNFTPQHREIMKQRLREFSMEAWGPKENPKDGNANPTPSTPKEEPKPQESAA